MSQITNAPVAGSSRQGVAGPAATPLVIPAIYISGRVGSPSATVGIPVYSSISTAARTGDNDITVHGDADLYISWSGSSPALTNYKQVGIVGIVTEVHSTDASFSYCTIQIQGICPVAKVDVTTIQDDALTMKASLELDVAVAGDAIVAFALANDVAGVAPVLLLGTLRGLLLV